MAYTGPVITGTPPITWDVKSPGDLIIGLTYQNRKGFFIGYGLSYSFNSSGDVVDANYEDGEKGSGDALGHQVRIGWHPGVRVYVAPAPPPPPPPPPPVAAPVNRPPTVKAQCDPCVVEVGRTSTVTANAQDPDGDTLAYKWSAPSGTFANPAERQTIFTCPQTPGSMPVTVAVSDGKGGTASDTVTIQCVAAGAQGIHVRRRALRLRPLLAAARSDAHPGRSGQGDAVRQHAPPHRRRPHLQHRHGRIQPRARRAPRAPRSATTWRAAASTPAGSTPSATVKSGRSTTTRAKRRAG